MSHIKIDDLKSMSSEMIELSNSELESVKGGIHPFDFIRLALWFFNNFDTVYGHWEAGSGWIVGIE